MEAGIRNRVEIWADGGYRHGWDIVKLHCLGANRVGFGTLAMVSLGCTICRGCQLDTCHVGIATQIETKEEAEQKGLKKFTPAGVRAGRRRTAPASSPRWARRCARSAPSSATSARRTWWAAATCSCSRARRTRLDLREMIRPLEEMLDLEPIDIPAAEEERSAPGLMVARPIRMGPKEASHELAALATDVCAGTLVQAARYPRAADADDRVLGHRAGGRAGARAHLPPGHARRRRRGHARATSTSTAARWRARASAPSTSTAWTSRVEGGAQDGVGKTMLGGKISIMKGRNRFGQRVNGSVGKSFAYGAQRGRLFVQGNADSRFCIRLSGADVVIGGEPEGRSRTSWAAWPTARTSRASRSST